MFLYVYSSFVLVVIRDCLSQLVIQIQATPYIPISHVSYLTTLRDNTYLEINDVCLI